MIGGAPEGYDSLLLAQIAADVSSPTSQVLYIAPHVSGMNRISDSLRFFSPDLHIITIPAWDCLPYDRVSPHTEIVARRLDALTRLSSGRKESAAGFITLTTVDAMLQRVPPRVVLENAVLTATEGDDLPQDKLLQFRATWRYC
jgi:transcription-repair coupling factor (superfamily II helicase)